MDLTFTKYQALGNDFILFDCFDQKAVDVKAKLATESWPRHVQFLCDRHLGVGADGVLVLWQNETGVRADLYNADGSLAEFCGNGARAVVAHLHHHHHFKEEL